MSKAEEKPPEVQAGTLEQALENGWQLLRSKPDMALAQAHAVLRRDGRNPEAYRLAAAAHRARGEGEHAMRAELSAIHHSRQVPDLAAAAKALDEGKPGEASRLAAGHLAAKPDDLAAITLSAESALALNLPERAEPLLRRVLERAPAFAPACTLLINALMHQDKLLESRLLVEKLLAARPGDEIALRLLANIQTGQGKHDGAASTYELLLKGSDRSPELWMLYGDTLRFIGRPVDSRVAYQRALALDCGFGQAWWALANLDPVAVSDRDIADMKSALADRPDRRESATNLHFALGTAFDARQRHEEAFTHFEAGNRLRRAAQPYRPGELSERIERSIETLCAGDLPQLQITGSGQPAPIFIVGMPRSGSTLVERVLGRHPQIEALGELPLVPHIVDALALQNGESTLESRIAALAPGRLRELGRRYLDRAAERRHGGQSFIVDKLHMNWRHLPLILRMLPQARVIDVRRSALDCCWSNHKLLSRGHPASADLRDIGRYFADYVRLMDHIDTVAPGRIHRLRYEALVDDIEGETRKMLDYVGVTFEHRTLQFHQSDQPVATASSEQVRRPLNRDGIGAWRPYAQWLVPLREALGSLADG